MSSFDQNCYTYFWLLLFSLFFIYLSYGSFIFFGTIYRLHYNFQTNYYLILSWLLGLLWKKRIKKYLFLQIPLMEGKNITSWFVLLFSFPFYSPIFLCSRISMFPFDFLKKNSCLFDIISCCVDEIAAQHVNADFIVHYGRSCLSPWVKIFHYFNGDPFIYISSFFFLNPFLLQ